MAKSHFGTKIFEIARKTKMKESPSIIYKFGEFEVDSYDESLRLRGEKLAINRRMFQVMSLLIERRGEIVTKEEFFERVWEGNFVEDNNLTVAITSLRKVLGDSARNFRFIENIPRKGYRFVGEVAVEAPSSLRDPHPDRVPSVPSSSRRFLFAGVGVSIVILLVLGIASFSGNLRTRAVKTAQKQQSIAVLPFKFRSSDSEYLAVGLADGIADSLGSRAELRVSDKNSTVALRDTVDRPVDAALQLGVENVVIGEVELIDQTLIINAELINAPSGSSAWKRQFRRNASEMLTTQQEIVGDLLKSLQVDGSATRMGVASDPKAYELYLKAQYYLDRREEDDIQMSVDLFKQAINIEPQFARAYVGLSEAYTLGAFGNVKFESGEKNALVRGSIQKAIDIDANLGEAYASRAISRCYYDWDFAGAESDYRKAIELEPSNSTAHHWFAEFLSMQGRFEESYSEYEKAEALDPLSTAIKTDSALAHYYARDYDVSAEKLKKTQAVDQKYLRTGSYIFAVYRIRGQYAEAIDALEKFYNAEIENKVRDNRDFVGERIAGLRRGLVSNGQRGYWAAEAKMEQYDACLGAYAYAQLGEREKAFELLDAAFRSRSSGLVWLKVEPLFDPLRDDPRFSDLLRRVGFVN